mgnify:FL=1
MQKKKGITLITLIVTIVVLIILASVATIMGLGTLEETRVVAFVSEMRIIQSRVDYIYEKIKIGEGDQYLNVGTPVTSELANFAQIQTVIDVVNANCETTGEPKKTATDFQYFSVEQLKEIGIEDVEQEVIIHFATRDVISLTGVKKDNTMYYRLFDLGEGSYIEYQVSTEKPKFTTITKTTGLRATISIENIVYGANINKGNIYYAKKDENNPEKYLWNLVPGTEISVTESGDYAIKMIDGEGNESDIVTVNVALVNTPKLEEGMIPVVWEEKAKKWKTVDKDSGEWYNYSSDAKKWANIMLQDELSVDANGYVTSMGSMFVWIPRYMYQIETLYHTSSTEGGKINIKFLKGNSTVPTDNTNVTIANQSGQGNWNIHPAFSNYGGQGLTGIWVAKFEATAAEGVGNSEDSDNVTNKNVRVVPNEQSWRFITIGNAYTVSTNMKNNTDLYGAGIANCDPHLMKNTEWGAVAYLTQSKYGRNGTEVALNNSTDCITGRSNGGIDGSENSFSYEKEEGQLASSTGNIYGIYDLNGGSFERIAAYIDTSAALTNGQELVNAPERHKNVYEASEDETSENNFEINSKAYGDAIYEISSYENQYSAWFSDYSRFSFGTDAFLVRGGGYYSTMLESGIFFYNMNAGVAATNGGFRSVLCII